MRIASLLAAQCVFFGIARSAPADDMASLSASCENAAAVLDASLNNTMAMVIKMNAACREAYPVLIIV